MKIRSDIQQRGTPTLTIVSNGSRTEVPITPASRRRFKLMEEDYIELSFSLAEPKHFAIGDYVVDNVFGSFYVLEEQMPKYNVRTGGYDYTLRFDADYMRWKNHLNCLIANNQRMETTWRLTDRLANHAQNIVDNVHKIFPPTEQHISDPTTGTTIDTSTGYGVSIESVAKADEAHHIDYNGLNLIESLNEIAKSYKCEWWVTDEKITIDGMRFDHTLHFGKCEESGNNPYIMALGDNVESMEISRDQQTYANRIYAYGGKQNIPESYDRSLVLTVTHVFQSADGTEFFDANRPFKADMAKGTTTYQQTALQQPAQPSVGSNVKVLSSTTPVSMDDYELSGQIETTLTWDWGQASHPANTPIVDVDIYINGEKVAVDDTPTPTSVATRNLSNEASSPQNRWSTWTCVFNLIGLPINGTEAITLEIRWTASFGTCTASYTQFNVTAQGSSATASKQIKVKIGNSNTQVDAIFNSNFSDGGAVPLRIYVGRSITVGTKITIPEQYLDMVSIPYSFFTLNYNVGTLNLLGERRLHLPLNDYPYRYAGDSLNQSRVVEMLVCFDDIYPKLSLVISGVTTETKTDEVEHEDGSIERQQWVQYKFTATKVGGGDFVFNTKYIMDGNTLQAVFMSPQTISANGYKLAGMTFDLGFDNGTQTYTLVRNETYGVKLPNDLLFPQVGDRFFLVGWNPKALTELDLVGDAEQELADAVEEYLDAINEGQFTFNCKMMSRTLQYYPFCTGNDQFGRRMYGLLLPGCKVTIQSDMLNGGSKTSRVLGYECKLDIPYDTPTYIVGETDAYSRLKQIEKQLTKL